MRDPIRDKDRLKHILKGEENIENFLQGVSEEEFYDNPILYHAIVNNLNIIGEASYKLTKEFTNDHPQTPWKQIINMRHFLIHGYYQVSKKIVWDTICNDLKPLKSQIKSYLEEIEKSNI